MMTSEASLPADDETEGYEAPIERVLKAAMAAEEAKAVQEAPEPWPPAASEPADEPGEAEVPVDEALEAAEPAAETEGPPASDMIDDPPASDVVDKSPEVETPNEAPTEAMAAWTEALRSVERSINEASEAIRFLRATIQEMAPLLRSVGGLEEALRGFGEQPRPRPEPPLEFEEGESRPDPGVPKAPHRDAGRAERDWPLQRRKAAARERAPQWVEEAESPWTPPAGPPRPAMKPVTLVPDDTPAPYGYRVTIEDRKGPVELMQLHRALTGIESVRNVSLLNYVNGVASLSIEATDEVQPQELENAVKKTMKRSCSVVPHESNVILIQVGE